MIDPGRIPTRLSGGMLVLVAALLLSVVVPFTALAHDAAEGEDVGFAHLRATQTDGTATVDLQISEAESCERFEPRRLVGQRAARSVTGSLHQTEPCGFTGTIELPEPGRWLVTAHLAYAGQPTEVSLSIGVTDSAQTFESAEWIHTVESEEGFWRSGDLFLYAAIGLLIGTVIEVTRRRFARRGTDNQAQ